VRAAAIAAFATYMVAPVFPQVLGIPVPEWVRDWQMYSTVGARVCQVAYFERRDGTDVPLSAEVAGTDGPPLVVQGLARHNGEVCARLPGADIRLDARCGSRQRWRVVEDRGRNICLP
jgi:hypothetical protein